MQRIPLNEGGYFIVDDDFEWLSQWKWYRDGSGYAHRMIYSPDKLTRLAAHRLVMGNPEGMTVDHINHNILDNRTENLRIVTHAQNCRNQKPRAGRKYKGTHFVKGKYHARICVDYVMYQLGSFLTEIEAAYVYDQAALQLHGEYAYLNILT